MSGPRIASIELGTFVGRRPRLAGYNARKKHDHGWEAPVTLARVTTSDGAAGFGVSNLSRQQAESFLGKPLDELITAANGVDPRAFALETPLWDLLGQRAGLPVYQVLAHRAGRNVAQPLRVPCYDTTLLIDDLHLPTDEEGAALIAAEARFGYEHGHRAFKIKVGRGARHNDDLTFHHSRPDDIWLHARHAAGAHVILRWTRPERPPAADLEEAAILAANHSGARGAGTVPVDWTRRKWVRKPRGAPPGAVIPDRVQTVFVAPDPSLSQRLRSRSG